MIRRILFQLLFAIIMVSATTGRAQVIGDLVTAEVVASRGRVYINEQFQVVLSITATGVNLDQNFQLAAMPDKNRAIFGEFRELPSERNLQGNQIRDKRRFICDVRAIMPGTLEIAPAIRLGVVSGFGPFRQISYHDIKAKGVSLTVLALPDAGKPPSFSGAVGQFTINSEISPKDVVAGDLVTVITTIKGKGYLEPLSMISIPPAPNFRVYPSKAFPGADSGTKVFEQILVPQTTNATIIPAISFCYFDPTAAAYTTVSSGPFRLVFHARQKTVADNIYSPKQTITKPPSSVSRTITDAKTYTDKHPYSKNIIIAVLYWALILAISLIITKAYRRGSIYAFCILVTAALIYLPFWNRLQTSDSDASVARREKARLAPAFSAVVSFEVSRGSTAKVIDIYGNWSKIQISGKKGWIPSDALTNSATADHEKTN